VRALLERAPTLSSDMLLRPFFEAYGIVADALAARDAQAAADGAQLLDECIGLGRQYVLQRRLAHPEAVSRHLFAAGLQLARHRGLCAAGSGVALQRTTFAAQLHGVLRRLHMVHDVAVRRVEAALAVAPGDDTQR
jgi:glycerol-3-phosphate O-acyltransferase